MLRKIVVRFLICLAFLIFLVLFFGGTILKYIVEHRSETASGRKITVEAIHLNYLSGSVKIIDFRVYEKDKSNCLFRFDTLSAGFSISKLLKNEYVIERLRIAKPVIRIVQDGSHFNFDDLLKLMNDSSSANIPAEKKEPVKYELKNFFVADGSVIYMNMNVHQNYSLQTLNVSAPLIAWNQPEEQYHADFIFNTGGKVNADVGLNLDQMIFTAKLKTDQFNLEPLTPYLEEFIKISSFSGTVSNDLYIAGNIHDPAAIAVKGSIDVNRLSLVSMKKDTVTSLERFHADIDSLNVRSDVYDFKIIAFDHPFVKFELFNNGNNFSEMLPVNSTGSPARKAMVVSVDTTGHLLETAPLKPVSPYNVFAIAAKYLKQIGDLYRASNYHVDSLTVTSGELVFHDFTLLEEFSYAIENYFVTGSRIYSDNAYAQLRLGALLNGKGELTADVKINPKDFTDLDLDYAISNTPVMAFSPYMHYYVAYPLEKGTLQYTGKNSVHHNKLKSENLLKVQDMTLGKKEMHKDAMNLPVKLAVSVLKDLKGEIKLDLPIQGDLNDPKFRLSKVIWGVIKNVLLKAAVSPYTLLSKAFGTSEDDLKEVPFDYLQTNLDSKQSHALESIIGVLDKKPELKATFVLLNNTEKEKEQCAYLRAKKMYYLSLRDSSHNGALTNEDMKAIEAISTKDSLFNLFLDMRLNQPGNSLPTQKKCRQLAGPENLQTEVYNLNESRKKALTDYLRSKQFSPERFSVTDSSDSKETQDLTHPEFLVNFIAAE